MQQFSTTEDLSAAVSFHHGDRNRFDPFVGREAEFAVEALPAAPNTATTISSPGFQDSAVGVLARGALHALDFQKDVPTLDIDSSLEKGLPHNCLIDEDLRLPAPE